MACGEKYQHLLVTASGLSLKNSFERVATDSDYTEWYELARTLAAMANERLHVLGDIEQENDSYPKWNELIPLHNKMVAELADLPHGLIYFGGWDWSDEIGRAQRVSTDAICLMELADRAIKDYGRPVPETPSVTPIPIKPLGSTPNWLKSIIIGTSVLAAAVAVTAVSVAVSKRAKPSPPPSAPATNPKRKRKRAAARPRARRSNPLPAAPLPKDWPRDYVRFVKDAAREFSVQMSGMFPDPEALLDAHVEAIQSQIDDDLELQGEPDDCSDAWLARFQSSEGADEIRGAIVYYASKADAALRDANPRGAKSRRKKNGRDTMAVVA